MFDNDNFAQDFRREILKTTDSSWLREGIEKAKETGSQNFKQQLTQTLDTVKQNHTQKQINTLESNFGAGGTDLTKKNKWG